MEKLNIILISTQNEVEEKIKAIQNALIFKKCKANIMLYTNTFINDIKNVEVIVLDKSKKELENFALSQVVGDVILLNLDYSQKTITDCLQDILNEKNNCDVVEFKKKRNKFFSFLHKIKITIYNLFYMIFGFGKLKDVNSDFQYLSKDIIKVIKNCEKTANFMRLFDNFSGYNIKLIEKEFEKNNYKKDFKFKIIAITLGVLAIIALGFLIYLIVKNFNSDNLSRIILLGTILIILIISASLGLFATNKFKNLV